MADADSREGRVRYAWRVAETRDGYFFVLARLDAFFGTVFLRERPAFGSGPGTFGTNASTSSGCTRTFPPIFKVLKRPFFTSAAIA